MTLKQQKILGLCLLAAYGVVSLLSATFYSDEFDQYRRIFLGFFVIPASFLFFAVVYFFPKASFKKNSWYWRTLVALFICHSWGILLLINALSGGTEETVAQVNSKRDSVYTYSYQRGGLGWLYKRRFRL